MKVLTKKSNKSKSITTNDIAMRLIKKKINRFKRSIFSSSMLLITFLSLSSFGALETKYSSLEGPVLNLTVIPELNAENVYIELVKAGIEHPEIVVKQAILETGWFKCEHCSLRKNNIFGFYYKKKYVEFDNWVESVQYYKRWQAKRYTLEDGDYFSFLVNVGYATDPSYVKLLKSIRLKFEIK